MKKSYTKLCVILVSLLVMLTTLAACGGGGGDNPFLGAWDDDYSEQSMIFNADGTGEQTSDMGSIPFTYTWDGQEVTISNEDFGVSSTGVLEDGELCWEYSCFYKVDEAGYYPDDISTPDTEDYSDDSGDDGSDTMGLYGTYADYWGDIELTFYADGSVAFNNEDIGEAGQGTYEYNGTDVYIAILNEDFEEEGHYGYIDDEGNIVIELWGDEVTYYPYN